MILVERTRNIGSRGIFREKEREKEKEEREREK